MTAAGAMPLSSWTAPNTIKLIVLHTNDLHSRIEPFPMNGGPNQGLGGISRRAALIEQIRATEEHVLLIDAGDIFQGTPYFNFFGGELEFKLMSQMGYDAATIGNHDFDAGIDGLEKQLPHANFPFIISNYDFKDTILDGRTKAYKIVKKGKLRIGMIGLGIELEGLVPKTLYKETRYLNPVDMANHYATVLKKEEKCDLVICLSHLGYKYRSNKVSDVSLAGQSRHIDLIIGGHTHTLLKQPERVLNLDGEPVLINQVGWGGMHLGCIELLFERNRRGRCVSCKNLAVGA